MGNFVFAQNFYLELQSESEKELKTIDSLSYQKTHLNPKSVTDEVGNFSEKLTKIGYLQHRVFPTKKANDSTFTVLFALGQKTDFIRISTSKAPYLKETGMVESDSLMIPFSEVESFMNSVMQKLEIRGYSMSKVKLEHFSFDKNILKSELTEQISSKRQLDDIVVMGYEKFSEGHKRQLKRMYKNRVFNQETLKELHQDIQKMAFVNQTKAPEILFTQDS